MVIGIPVTLKLKTLSMKMKYDLDIGTYDKPYRNDAFKETLISVWNSIEVSLLVPMNNQIEQYFYRRWI